MLKKKSDFYIKGNSEFVEDESTKILDLGHGIYSMNVRTKAPQLPASEFTLELKVITYRSGKKKTTTVAIF